MPEALAGVPRTPAAWLLHGQFLEVRQQFTEAIAAYDRAIASLPGDQPASSLEHQRQLALAWMNRGNALQKTGATPALRDAVRSYDEAIAIFQTLPFETEPALRNHLGVAWMNRGHALMMAEDKSAVASLEEAVAQLRRLPLDTDPFYRLNLAGAWTNLAHSLLSPATPRAAEPSRAAARNALEALATIEQTNEDFAAMSLRARRAQVMALGELLATAGQTSQAVTALVAEATDSIEGGLVIACEFERRGVTQLRPLTLRLFRLGAQLYCAYQPHFLGEFLLETLRTPALAADEDFRAVANDALAIALAHLQRPQLLLADTREGEKALATARSLRAAQLQLSTLVASHAIAPASLPA
jgi:tetratricopeptide (TPR) repeat protein